MSELIPVIIENVSLRVDLRVDSLEEKDKLAKQFELVNQLRDKFGEDVLLEQLSTLLPGTIEKVTIKGGERVSPEALSQTTEKPAQQKKKLSQAASHVMTSPRFKGHMVCNVDPALLWYALDISPEDFSAEDYQMASAYRIEYQTQQVLSQPPIVSFDDDDIPF